MLWRDHQVLNNAIIGIHLIIIYDVIDESCEFIDNCFYQVAINFVYKVSHGLSYDIL